MSFFTKGKYFTLYCFIFFSLCTSFVYAGLSGENNTCSYQKKSLFSNLDEGLETDTLPERLISKSIKEMSSTTKPYLLNRSTIIEPEGDHKYTVIFLHGLGDSGKSFVDVFEMLKLHGTRVILPDADVIPVTVNGGYRMPAWFDIIKFARDVTPNDKQDSKSILQSADRIIELLDHELTKVKSSEHVFLGGFSQGAAMSLHVGTRYDHKLGGVIACSGFYPLPYEADKYITRKDVHILGYHGTADPVVPLNLGEKSINILKEHGVENIQFVTEPNLQHSLSHNQLRTIHSFIKDRMNAANGN